MRTFILLCFLICFQFYQISAQTDFILDPMQSMIMTGKGVGQDATVNPYYGKNCYAIVENIGEREFSARIQQDGKILEDISLMKGETKRITLLKGYELYLDPNPNGIANARVSYEEMIN